MVEIGIVPTKVGYAAVGLRETLGKSKKLIIRAPFLVSEDLKTRILGRFYREVADYLWDVGKWEGIGFVALLWAVVGIITLACNRLFTYGTKFVLLYLWVRIWFLADGVFLFLPYIFKVSHRLRARRVRKILDGMDVDIELVDWPTLEIGNQELDEGEYIADMMERFPNSLGKYYNQMLQIDPPWLMDQYPFTVLSRVRNWVLGAPIRLPQMIYFVGRDL